MASWKLTLRHNLAGKTIPVELKYTGNSSFPTISISVTSSSQAFSLTGWDADTLDASKIAFVNTKVTDNGVIYNLKSLQITPYQDGGESSLNETGVDIDGTIIDDGGGSTNETGVDIDGTIIEEEQ